MVNIVKGFHTRVIGSYFCFFALICILFYFFGIKLHKHEGTVKEVSEVPEPV